MRLPVWVHMLRRSLRPHLRKTSSIFVRRFISRLRFRGLPGVRAHSASLGSAPLPGSSGGGKAQARLRDCARASRKDAAAHARNQRRAILARGLGNRAHFHRRSASGSRSASHDGRISARSHEACRICRWRRIATRSQIFSSIVTSRSSLAGRSLSRRWKRCSRAPKPSSSIWATPKPAKALTRRR